MGYIIVPILVFGIGVVLSITMTSSALQDKVDRGL